MTLSIEINIDFHGVSKYLIPAWPTIYNNIVLYLCTRWADVIDGWLVIKPKRFSVTIADLEIERTIVAFAIAGWVLKKFAQTFAMIVALEIGKIIVVNVIAGWEV